MKFILPLFLFLTVKPLFAQSCNYNLQFSPFNAQVSENPQVIEHNLSISRPTNSSQANCSNYHVYFSQGQANSYQRQANVAGNNIPYNVYKESNLSSILKDFGDASTNERLEGSLPDPNVTDQQSFYVRIPSLEEIFNSPANVYFDQILMNVYSVRSNGTLLYQRTGYLNILITIPRFAQLSLIPENAPFDPDSTSYTMNFGVMSSNQELGADLRVRGNVPFGIYMSSLNGSELVKQTQSVPYQIKVGDGNFRDLKPAGSMLYITQSNSRTNLDGNRYNIRTRLGEVPSSLDGGTYQDTITITIQAW